MDTPTLTTPESFRKHLNANPHDWYAMAIYADCLDEQDVVYMKCRACKEGYPIVGKTKCPLTEKEIPVLDKRKGQRCAECEGRCEVIDPTNKLLAEGYRALSVVRPVYDQGSQCWWGWMSHLPVLWWGAMSAKANKATGEAIFCNSSIEGLDTAALAWASLSAETKLEIMTNGPWAQKG